MGRADRRHAAHDYTITSPSGVTTIILDVDTGRVSRPPLPDDIFDHRRCALRRSADFVGAVLELLLVATGQRLLQCRTGAPFDVWKCDSIIILVVFDVHLDRIAAYRCGDDDSIL